MWEIRGNVQDFSGAHDDYFVLILSQLETKRAFEDVGDLFVVVRMLGDDTTFLEVDVGEHHPLTVMSPAIEHVVDSLFRHVLPAVESCAAVECFHRYARGVSVV
jgi:hypothetical protein